MCESAIFGHQPSLTKAENPLPTNLWVQNNAFSSQVIKP